MTMQQKWLISPPTGRFQIEHEQKLIFFFHCPIGGPFEVLSFDVDVELASSSKRFVSELFRSIFVSSLDTIHQQENLSFKKRRNQYLKVTWTCLSQQTCDNSHTHLFWIYLGKIIKLSYKFLNLNCFPYFSTPKKGGNSEAWTLYLKPICSMGMECLAPWMSMNGSTLW